MIPKSQDFPALGFLVAFLGPSVGLERFLGFGVVADVPPSWSTSMAEAESVAVGGTEIGLEDPYGV